MMDDQGWGKFFDECDPVEPDQMTLVEFEEFMTRQITDN